MILYFRGISNTYMYTESPFTKQCSSPTLSYSSLKGEEAQKGGKPPPLLQ